MIISALNTLVFLHAGTSPAVSQLSLTIMLVVLGITLLGVGFGRISKTKVSLLQHRWTLTTAVILAVSAISFVMVPTAFRFYIAPDLDFFGSISLVTLIHMGVGFPAVVTAVIYVFGDLPTNVKKWMHIAAALWVGALVLGAVLFLQTIELI